MNLELGVKEKLVLCPRNIRCFEFRDQVTHAHKWHGDVAVASGEGALDITSNDPVLSLGIRFPESLEVIGVKL